MSDYRTSERWGRLLSEHRARAGNWLGGALLSVVAALLLGRYVAGDFAHASAKSMLGVPLLLFVGAWMAREWYVLRQVRLTVHEHGFRFFDAETHHEVPWDEIRSIEGQYVPGVLKKGTADEGNLTMVIVESTGARVALPAELERFAAFRKQLERRTGVRWRRTLIANLTERG
jgi:hypothetical protein